MEVVASSKQPEDLWDKDDKKESDSNYSDDDGWGATEDLFEAEDAKKTK